MLNKDDKATLINKGPELLRNALESNNDENINVFYRVSEYQQNKRVILLLLKIGIRTYLVVKNHQNSETLIIDTYGNNKERVERLNSVFNLLHKAKFDVTFVGDKGDAHLIDNNIELFANESILDYTIRKNKNIDLQTMFEHFYEGEYKQTLLEIEAEKRLNWLPNQDFYLRNLLDSDLVKSVAGIFAIKEMYEFIAWLRVDIVI